MGLKLVLICCVRAAIFRTPARPETAVNDLGYKVSFATMLQTLQFKDPGKVRAV